MNVLATLLLLTWITPDACLPLREFRIGGIRLDDSVKSVQRRLGKPRKVEVGQSEDDGGYHEVRHETYDGVDVYYSRGHVDSIVVTSPKFAMPSGVRVGTDAVDLAARLRFDYSSIAGENNVHVLPCQSGGMRVLFTLADAGNRTKVAKIEIASDYE